NTFLNERNNQYFRSLAAAEAATEKVLTQIKMDYDAEGENMVFANLGVYRTMIPNGTENKDWNSYAFYDLQNTPSRTSVENSAPTEYRDLASQYRGLRGYATPIRIASRVREAGRVINVVGGIQQDVDLASIPIFQFAIFYNIDLEINPGPQMTVTGPVHCNANIYLQPGNVLTFNSDVTAAGDIIHDKKPGDPLVRSGGTIIYKAEHTSKVSSLNLPIGTNNSPSTVRLIVEVPPPPALESLTSLMGRQRFFNKADLVILVTNGAGGSFTNPTVIASSGMFDVFSTKVPASEVAKFMTTTNTAWFQNNRENRKVTVLDLDIAKLGTWNANNTVLRPKLPYLDKDMRIVYVADLRTGRPANTEPGVRLINGQTILPHGLTVASPDPMYIKGHYNAPAAHLGTANTSATKPAAVIGDSITILSSAFNDSTGSGTAVNTTVNAALLAGIVETVPGSYSGGVENFPRFLEDWGNATFTYNGSMVVMYDSRWAIAQWNSGSGYYSPPKRNWAFDQNFRDVTKLPPGTPMMRVLVRGNWAKM
ncbi:MAG TPA: hypothetical protein VJ063_02150, partial [Verrucomicrobiae bacterium]|nr:hypothetical protein [Verrucomicrobiae bacterium]